LKGFLADTEEISEGILIVKLLVEITLEKWSRWVGFSRVRIAIAAGSTGPNACGMAAGRARSNAYYSRCRSGAGARVPHASQGTVRLVIFAPVQEFDAGFQFGLFALRNRWENAFRVVTESVAECTVAVQFSFTIFDEIDRALFCEH
jgi:hypothetical protein